MSWLTLTLDDITHVSTSNYPLPIFCLSSNTDHAVFVDPRQFYRSLLSLNASSEGDSECAELRIRGKGTSGHLAFITPTLRLTAGAGLSIRGAHEGVAFRGCSQKAWVIIIKGRGA